MQKIKKLFCERKKLGVGVNTIVSLTKEASLLYGESSFVRLTKKCKRLFGVLSLGFYC